MRRLIDCQMAIVPWGAKARYRKAKVGLLRKGSSIYIAVFYSTSDNHNFPLDSPSTEILPAAIRFRNLEKDLFIRQVSDEQRYDIMIREIKLILKKDEIRQKGKADKLDKFISTIPSFDTFNLRDLVPARDTARIIAKPTQHATSVILDQKAINENDVNQRNFRHKNLDNKQLKSIIIRGLERLPDQLWQRDFLNTLTLADCNLTSIPQQLEEFSSSLTSLDLSGNRIDKLPRTFCCKMNNLKWLNLSHNLIETLPIEIKFFRRLVELNISNNHLRMLPSTFSDLRSLRILDVAHNNLSQLPAFRRDEISLKYLDVSYNPLDGALNEANTFEVHPSIDESLSYEENLFCPLTPISKNLFPTLFEISILNVARCDRLLKLACDESLPRTIVSTLQRDIFKCYKCGQMNILPAYNSTDRLDYVHQVEVLKSTGNYAHGMTFMKLLCRSCFDNMSS